MSTPAAVQSAKQNLLEVESGRISGPLITFLIGVEGIGKSTFAKDAGAVFLDVDNGTRKLKVDRLKRPEVGWTWPAVLDRLYALASGQHNHSAVAIDTVDALESLIWASICARDGKTNIEDYGYGKGYIAALDEWRLFTSAIEKLRDRRGMHVLLLAHATVRPFKNPEGEDFDRYQPAIHEKAAGLLKAKSDTVLFANFETFAKKKDERNKIEKAKGIATDRRLIYTKRSAAYDAKNRHDLPDTMDLSWTTYSAAIERADTATSATLRLEIEAKGAQMKDEKARADLAGGLNRAGEDEQKLRQLSNWATAKLIELAAAAAQQI